MKERDLRPSGGQPLGSSLSKRLSSEGSSWGEGVGGGGGSGGRRLEVKGGRVMWQTFTLIRIQFILSSKSVTREINPSQSMTT